MKLKIFSFSLLFILIFSLNSCRDFTNTALNLMGSTDTATTIFPAPLGSVSDYEKILTDEQIRSLDSIILQHEKKTKNRISIVSVKSTKPYETLNEYSSELFESWGKNDDGGKNLLIGISEKTNEVEIIVGKGLKKKLSDKESKRIIDKTIQPEIKKGDYYSGLKKGLKKIITEIK
ncbi:MAG TPA: TPM domain-containing protein [Bacteroidales bacterium]|nr:TPM domain-containing protein [Bacteroidales bacterium]